MDPLFSAYRAAVCTAFTLPHALSYVPSTCFSTPPMKYAGKAADVKRCHALRGALPLLDFEDEESIGDLKRLLLRAAFSPAFLRPPEGRRFLSSLFSLQVCLSTAPASLPSGSDQSQSR